MKKGQQCFCGLKASGEPDADEWQFEFVADDELLSCLFYEFGRESKTIIELSQSVKGSNLPLTGKHKVAVRDAVRQLAEPLYEAHTLLRGDLSLPWQKLSQKDREQICATVKPPAPSELPPFRRLTCLKKLGFDESCVEINREAGVERLRVEIDWENFTDDQLAKYFKTWAIDNRPFGKATNQGKDMDSIRVKLQQLGLLRLWHHLPFAQFPKVKTATPTKFVNKGESNRERKKALLIFRELFPFLPENENPLHFQAFTERMK
jgi:hypothetical protein